MIQKGRFPKGWVVFVLLFPSKIVLCSHVPMFPHFFLICSTCNKFACHLSPPSIPSRKKEKTPQKAYKRVDYILWGGETLGSSEYL